MAKKRYHKKPAQPIIYQITQTSIKRSTQDIENWRRALRAAESKLSPRRVLLYDLYSDIILGAHLSSVIEKRLLAIVNAPVVFQDSNGQEVEAVQKLIDSPKFLEMIKDALDSKFWGHSLMELATDGESLQSELIPRKHVNPANGHILLHQSASTGFPFREPPYNMHTLEVGQSEDLGLLLKAAPYVIYKRGGFADWAEFLEIFGMPLRVGKYDGNDLETRQQLDDALENAGSAAYMTIPREADIEFESSNATGDKELYKAMVDMCNKEISKLIVGQTMTSDDGSSHSQSKVHLEVEESIHQADRLFIKNILNTKFKPWLESNGLAVTDGTFTFKEVDTSTPQQKLDIALSVNKVAPVDKTYFYETFNLPEGEPLPPQHNDKPTNRQTEETKNLFKQFLALFQ